MDSVLQELTVEHDVREVRDTGPQVRDFAHEPPPDEDGGS